MKRLIRVMAWVLPALALVIFIGPRLYVKNPNAHLTIDGRVTDDFKLYFGPGGKLLLRIGAKQPKEVFFHSGATADPYAHECAADEVMFPPFVAISKHWRPRCVLQIGMGDITENSLRFRLRDGHEYEVTWQPPPR